MHNRNKPKVLLVCPWAHSNSYYTAKFCNALALTGVSVFLVIPANFMTYLLSHNVRQIRWPYVAPERTRLTSLLCSPFQAIRLFRIILQTKPDWIHLLWTHQVPILLVPFLKRFPVAYTAHDPVLHPGEAGILRGWIHERHIRMAKICFVHGEENKQKLIENYGVDPQSIYVIPHGEFLFWNNLPPVEQENRILFFGRIRRYKGIEVLLDAFEKISPCIPNYRLSICGKGNLGGLSFRIRSMPNVDLENRFIDHEEIPSLFLRSRFLILPYIDATQSGVVPMAFALGRTCIVSAVGSIPEIVYHEDNGLLVQPGDLNELAAAMLKLAQDETLLRRLEQGALKAARSSDSLTWNHAARIAAAAYHSSMGS